MVTQVEKSHGLPSFPWERWRCKVKFKFKSEDLSPREPCCESQSTGISLMSQLRQAGREGDFFPPPFVPSRPSKDWTRPPTLGRVVCSNLSTSATADLT